MSSGRVLVVDDEPQIRRVMRTTLSANGYEVSDVRSGEEALQRLQSEDFDLVLLDYNMPGLGGLETCRAIREGRGASIPAIIMLTVRSAETDKVQALDAGADDYVTKPFSTPELLARIRAALRRAPAGPAALPQRISLEELEIDFGSRQVEVRGRAARLTPKEFDLLRFMVSHRNRVLAHREILQAIWGPDYGDQVEYLRVFVNQLRKKIEIQPTRPRHILTEPWVGYRFQARQQD
jgi:two-component system, OmpR family, KDP operon response regulator KdpE